MKPKFSVLTFALLLLLCSLVRAQQDQTHDSSNPEDIWPQNSEWVNGWSAGYWVTCTSGLSCAVSKGTCFDSSDTRHTYGGGTISITNATNYIDLKDSDCSIEISTSGYQSRKHLATVVASAGSVTSGPTNDRGWFTFALTGAGNLTPLFTTSISGSTLNFALSNAAANTVFGNFTASSGAPSYNSVTACGDSTHALSWIAGTGFGCQAFTIPSGTVTSIATTSPITGGTITSTGTIACPTCVTSVTGTSPVASSGGTTPAISINNNGITATQLASQYSKGSCTEVWGGSGTSNAMQSGDDAIVNNGCYNDSGVTRTITAVKCRGDNASNSTTVNPTFGSAGTGTTILSGALTCGNSYAYSSSGTVSNASWTTGTGIDPGMATVGNATSIAMIVEYTY